MTGVVISLMTINDAARQFVDGIAKIPPEKQKEDFVKGGILYCGKCGDPKQAWIDWFPSEDGNPQKNLVRIMCKCDMEREKREAEITAQENFDDAMRRINLSLHTERKDIRWTFDQDDSPDTPISKTCRKYVVQWDEMKRDNLGILFYGRKGNGKSFYASCIYNALIEKRVTAGFTSTANLMNILGKWDRTEIMDALTRVKLLVLDDLGAERDTSYSAELLYSVIDARYKAALPTIITTNLAPADMEAEDDAWRSRIYDRVVEMCPIAIRMDGESRRAKIADERKKKARELLKGVTP